MPTRILPVRDAQGDPYPLAGQGIQATATVEVEASASAAADVARTGSSTSSATATITAAATTTRAVAATSTTSAVITAMATVDAPTDITSLLTEGSGFWNPGGLIVPGYDQAYAVTVSDAAFDNYPTIRTPGVRVTLPLPSTPNAAHSLTITYTVSGRSRRVFHDFRTRWRNDGHIIEPNPLGTTTVAYAWDTAAHEWYVASTTGTPTERQHGPDENPDGVPLFFSPECRALATFDDIKAAHIAALAGLPSSTAAALRAAGQAADVVGQESDYIFEAMLAREVFDPTWSSGASGRYDDPFAAAYAWMSDNPVNGRTMLHELGHAWDTHGLAAVGNTWGYDPILPGSPNENDTVTVYYEDGVTKYYEFVYTATTVVWEVYDTDGVTVILGGTYDRPQYALFQDEQPIRDLYALVPDKPGNYYRSLISEWVPQCFMLAWADHVDGFNATQRNTLISEIGGATIFGDFVDYAVTSGVLPSSW